MIETKECAQCHAEKDSSQFRKVANMYTAAHLMSLCKECYKQNQERYRHEWEEREAAREAERRVQEEALEQQRRQREAERLRMEEEWQRKTEEWDRQRKERQQWLANWFDQRPDRTNYIHPSLMQLPQEGEEYPALKIDDLVKYYWRWTSTYAVRRWLCSLENQEYCVLDTETTGSRRFSQVIEIAILNKQGSIIYTTLLQPTTSIEPIATSIHGLTWNNVKDAPQFSQVYQEIYAHLAGKLVLAYNASFDIHSLFRTARAFQVPFPRLQVGCLLYAYSKLRGERYEESEQFKRFALAKACINEEIDFPGVQQIDGNYYQTDFHRAEHDARYLYELLQRMIQKSKPTREEHHEARTDQKPAPAPKPDALIAQVDKLGSVAQYTSWLAQLSDADFTAWKAYSPASYYAMGAIEAEQERRERGAD